MWETTFADATAAIERATAGGHIPGAALLVRIDGRTACERAVGRRRIAAHEPLQADDIFAVASLTKPLVAASVLQLCEHGRLGLDEPVFRYLPGFAEPTVLLSYDVETRATATRRARRDIVVRDLLTHTAGIHHGFPEIDSVMGTLYQRAGVIHDARQSLDEKIRRLGPLPLAHDPGTAWTYGLCSDAAARLVEVIAGEPFDRYLAREIFKPLGMDTTGYVVAPEHRGRVAARHLREADGALTPMSARDGDDDTPNVSGGGGLYTTLADYARLVGALLAGGPPILSPTSVGAMTSVQTPHVTTLGLRYGFSLGLATEDAPGRYPLPLGGFGWYGIFGTWFWALPRLRTVVLMFSHVLDHATHFRLFSEVATAVEHEVTAV